MTGRTSGSTAGPSGRDLPHLDVSLRTDGSSDWVIEVRGELDLFTGPTLRAQLESFAPSDAERRRIIYLLPGLDFMDARGLHFLLTAVDGHGPEAITVREPSPRVRRLLELVGMDSMIEEPTNR